MKLEAEVHDGAAPPPRQAAGLKSAVEAANKGSDEAVEEAGAGSSTEHFWIGDLLDNHGGEEGDWLWLVNLAEEVANEELVAKEIAIESPKPDEAAAAATAAQ